MQEIELIFTNDDKSIKLLSKDIDSDFFTIIDETGKSTDINKDTVCHALYMALLILLHDSCK